jgi:hypothetical protein
LPLRWRGRPTSGTPGIPRCGGRARSRCRWRLSCGESARSCARGEFCSRRSSGRSWAPPRPSPPAALVLAQRQRLEAPRLAFVAFAVVAACLSAKMYVEAYSSARALTAAPFVALVLAVQGRNGWSRALLVAGPVTFALSGLLMIAGELGVL